MLQHVHEQPLTQFVELGKQLATQVTRRPHDEVLEFQATEPVAQRALENSQ